MRCSTCTEPAVGYLTENLRPYCAEHLEQMIGALWQGRMAAEGLARACRLGGPVFRSMVATAAGVEPVSDDRERESDAAFLRSLGIEP